MRNLARIATIATLLCGYVALSHIYAQQALREQATTEKTVAARELNRIKASVKVGPIHVIADTDDSIRIKAVRHVEGGSANDRRRWLQEASVSIEQHGDALEVRDVVPASLQHFHPAGRDFKMHLDVDIHLPRRLSLDLTSGVGDVEVDGSAGGIVVDTGVGTVQLRQLQCEGTPVSAHTGVGDIHLEGRTGTLTVQAGAGRVDLKGLECSGRTVHVEDGAGDVRVALRSAPTDSLKVHVGTGSVKVSLPAQARANVEMSTGVGDVHSAFSLSSMRRSGSPVGGALSGDLNGGGFGLRLDVGVGDIRLDKGEG